uniref:Uncharacterized protein n=1 Tax=Homalodisca liturata TaxID=320908 RepID=A0A1B6IHC3_9HEMI
MCIKGLLKVDTDWLKYVLLKWVVAGLFQNKEGRNMSKVVSGYYMRQDFGKWLLIQQFAMGVLKPISRTQIEIDKKEAIIPISPTTPIMPEMNGVGWNRLTSVENNLGEILQMRLKRSVTRKKRKRKPRHKEAGKTLQRKRAKKRKQKQRRVERKRLRMLTHARRLRKQKKSKQARLERHYARMNMTTPFPGYIMNHTRENNTLLRKYDLNEQGTSDTRQENTEEEYTGETYEDENEDSSHEESDEYSDENSADNGNDDYDDDDYDDSDEDEDDNSDYENIEYENVEDKPYKPDGDKSDNTEEKHHLKSAQVGKTKTFVGKYLNSIHQTESSNKISNKLLSSKGTFINKNKLSRKYNAGVPENSKQKLNYKSVKYQTENIRTLNGKSKNYLNESNGEEYANIKSLNGAENYIFQSIITKFKTLQNILIEQCQLNQHDKKHAENIRIFDIKQKCSSNKLNYK